MSAAMNLAVIQMVSQDDVQTNLRLARRMLELSLIHI